MGKKKSREKRKRERQETGKRKWKRHGKRIKTKKGRTGKKETIQLIIQLASMPVKCLYQK